MSKKSNTNDDARIAQLRMELDAAIEEKKQALTEAMEESMNSLKESLAEFNATASENGMPTYQLVQQKRQQRTRRTNEERQNAIDTAVSVIKKAKSGGASAEEITEAIGFKLTPSVKFVLSKAGHDVKVIGSRRTARYTMA